MEFSSPFLFSPRKRSKGKDMMTHRLRIQSSLIRSGNANQAKQSKTRRICTIFKQLPKIKKYFRIRFFCHVEFYKKKKEDGQQKTRKKTYTLRRPKEPSIQIEVTKRKEESKAYLERDIDVIHSLDQDDDMRNIAKFNLHSSLSERIGPWKSHANEK